MRYITKPVEIEAVEWDGTNEGYEEVCQFMTGKYVESLGVAVLLIRTPEGDMRATVGDFIIKGMEGEFYPCKPSIFNAKYEAIED